VARRRTAVLAAALAAVAAAVPGATAGAGGSAKPRFAAYAAPSGVGDEAGEPTLGADPRTGQVYFQAGPRTLAVTFDGRGGSRWRDVSPLLEGLYTLDPILETDRVTGRTFTSQLDTYCSRMAYTDDRGETWTQVPLGCGIGALFDHQSVGTGAFRPGTEPLGSYPNAVYYCAQTVATANCSTSLDGGFTFLPANVAWTAATCDTAHGHLQAAPDGTVYLPPETCGGHAGLARSDDNGRTWTVHVVPGSTFGDAMDPSVGVGSDGTVYYAWGGRDGAGPGGAAYVSVSRDRAETWTKPVALGRDLHVRNTRFVSVVAGDGDRAAVSFLGTTTGGDGSLPGFTGEWHEYVSFTWDRGRHWTTVDATPRAPVQVGGICTSGTLCTQDRNLLDFADLTIDPKGRVLAAIADGCPGPVCTAGVRGSKATILRQESGRGLLRRYD
jgi:hypothetical protein